MKFSSITGLAKSNKFRGKSPKFKNALNVLKELTEDEV